MATQVGLDHDTVVAAAGDLVDEEGVEALTLARLAKRLGIRSQSLYAHVDGLDGLLRDLALDSVRTLGEQLRSSVIGRSGRTALEAIADAYWDYATAHPGRYAATIRDPGDDDELRAANLRAAEALTRVMESFGCTGVDEVHAHRIVWSSIHGFLVLEHAGVMRRPASVRESYRRMIAIYADALAPPSDGHSASAFSPNTRA
jgi:AcrR family transcriptional regulator